MFRLCFCFIKKRDCKYSSLSKNTFNCDLCTTDVNDSFYQGEAKTIALSGMRGISLIKLVKYVLSCLFRNTTAGI